MGLGGGNFGAAGLSVACARDAVPVALPRGCAWPALVFREAPPLAAGLAGCGLRGPALVAVLVVALVAALFAARFDGCGTVFTGALLAVAAVVPVLALETFCPGVARGGV